MPGSKTNEKEAKTSYISELLCSSIVDPPQHITIIAKADSGVSNNYCCTEDMLLLTNLKENVMEQQSHYQTTQPWMQNKLGSSHFQEV